MLLNLFLTILFSLNILATLTFFVACIISGKEAQYEVERLENTHNRVANYPFGGKANLTAPAAVHA